MDFGSDLTPPKQFRYTFEDNIGKGNDQRQAREPNLENELWKRSDPAKTVSVQFR